MQRCIPTVQETWRAYMIRPKVIIEVCRVHSGFQMRFAISGHVVYSTPSGLDDDQLIDIAAKQIGVRRGRIRQGSIRPASAICSAPSRFVG